MFILHIINKFNKSFEDAFIFILYIIPTKCNGEIIKKATNPLISFQEIRILLLCDPNYICNKKEANFQEWVIGFKMKKLVRN